MIVYERRASTVLYNLLSARDDRAVFLLPANVCPIIPMTFLKARQPFEFVDIDPATLCIDEGAVLDRWSKEPSRYGGLLFVRTYGSVHDTHSFFCELRSLAPDALLIDDSCLCAASFPDTPPTFVDAQLFSTGYAKYVDIGGGGYGVLAPNTPYATSVEPCDAHAYAKLDSECKSALAHRTQFRYEHDNWLDTSAPDLSWPKYQNRVNLELRRIVPHKAEINALYSDALPPEICLPSAFQQWRFNIRVRDKQSVLRMIRDCGLFASGHYASLAGIFSSGRAPNAESLHATVVNLFNDRYFSVAQAEQLADVVRGRRWKPFISGMAI